MTGDEQQELLQAFRAGDKLAFERVFRLHYNALRVQAFLLLNSNEDAEDQVQQLFLDLWNKELFRNVKESLKAYLHTAIRNRCYNFIASRKSHLSIELAEENPETDEQSYIEPALTGRFKHALGKLPQQRSKAFQLVYLEDKKYLQAAEEMGISINSLKSHLKLAVKFLRLQLQK